jgi:DNA invertase Pin-like site-specific DNA recombinase
MMMMMRERSESFEIKEKIKKNIKNKKKEGEHFNYLFFCAVLCLLP